MPTKLCYFGCKLDVPMHRFPKPGYHNEARFNKWLAVLSEETKLRGTSYILRNIYICDRHFELKFRTVGRRLTANSYPTLNLSQLYRALDNENSETASSAEGTVSTGSSMMDIRTEISHTTEETLPKASSKDAYQISKQSKPQQQRAGSKKKVFYTEKIRNSKTYQLLKMRLLKLQNKCKDIKKSYHVAEMVSKNENLVNVIDKLPKTISTFMRLQLKSLQKPRGRKFTLKEKIFALSILKQSPRAYNFLTKILVLPSKRTLQKILKNIVIEPGLNENILNNLKKKVDKMTPEQRLCNLMFDEIALTPGLYYNRSIDQIIGFEKDTQKIADHCLVFMIKGLKNKYKQPICYQFCQSATKSHILKALIIDIIRRLRECGLIIVATICDQGTSNVSAINSLLKDTKEKYLRLNKVYKSSIIEIDDTPLFHIYDPPHLLKGLRNNWISKNIRYIFNGEVMMAKWEHLKMLLEVDVEEDDLRMLNKLTIHHVQKDKLPKMKVKYAAQVFSQRVAATMNFLTRHKALPEECRGTAIFINIIDQLFDSFNGSKYKDDAKPLKGCLKRNSAHFKKWNEFLPNLRSIGFETVHKQSDGTEFIKYVQVPSLKNWIKNIESMKEIFNLLNKEYDVQTLLTRNFNQDPLENFFCCIRSHGVRNISPTCSQFSNAYKSLIINNYTSHHSVGANCEKDGNKLLQNLKSLVVEGNINHEESYDNICLDPLINVLNENNDSISQKESKQYVAGYIIKKCKPIFKSCRRCKNELIKKHDISSYIYERDYTKKSLFSPSEALYQHLNEINHITHATLKDSPGYKKVKKRITDLAEIFCNPTFLTCSIHKNDLILFINNYMICLLINSWCTNVNRLLKGKMMCSDDHDLVKLQAYTYYKTHNKCNK